MIKSLTSLRFFFSFFVMASHFSFLESSNNIFLKSFSDNVLDEGFEVCFFYVLSGFILTYRYHSEFEKKTINIKKFYISRIARIYPLHIITLIIAVPLTIRHLDGINLTNTIKFVTNFFLLQSHIPKAGFYFSFNTVSWSISNDIFFCFLFPFTIPFINQLITKKNKYCYIIGIIAIIPLLMLIIPKEKQYAFFYINPFFRIFDYIIGILLFYLYQFIKNKKIKINYTTAEVSSILILILFVFFKNLGPDVTRYSIYYWIPMASIVLAFSFQNGKLSQLLSHPFFTFLGSLSFSIYLIHRLVIKYFEVINRHYIGVENEFLKMGIIITITFIVSYISSKYIERPLGTKLKLILNSKTKQNNKI